MFDFGDSGPSDDDKFELPSFDDVANEDAPGDGVESPFSFGDGPSAEDEVEVKFEKPEGPPTPPNPVCEVRHWISTTIFNHEPVWNCEGKLASQEEVPEEEEEEEEDSDTLWDRLKSMTRKRKKKRKKRS